MHVAGNACLLSRRPWVRLLGALYRSRLIWEVGACFSLGSPEADLETRDPVTVLHSGRWSQDPLERTRGRKSIQAVLLSKLPLRATGVQFSWDPLGAGVKHVSVVLFLPPEGRKLEY